MSDFHAHARNGSLPDGEKLRPWTIAAYALGMSSGRQFITALVSTYILIFFTDTFGVPAAAAGTIMFLATIWDAVNAPHFGRVLRLQGKV